MIIANEPTGYTLLHVNSQCHNVRTMLAEFGNVKKG